MPWRRIMNWERLSPSKFIIRSEELSRQREKQLRDVILDIKLIGWHTWRKYALAGAYRVKEHGTWRWQRYLTRKMTEKGVTKVTLLFPSAFSALDEIFPVSRPLTSFLSWPFQKPDGPTIEVPLLFFLDYSLQKICNFKFFICIFQMLFKSLSSALQFRTIFLKNPGAILEI